MLKKLVYSSMTATALFAATLAHATALPGVYVNAQIGYANTHMSNQTNFAKFGSQAFIPFNANKKNLSNNGLAGRIALGYQFNQNFAIEAGYLQLSHNEVTGVTELTPEPLLAGKVKLQQHAVDLLAKGIIPINSKFNVYGKLGVAYLTTNINGKFMMPEGQSSTVDLNNYTQIDRHTLAPEAAIGISYDLTPQVSLDTSWTHIQPIGHIKPGNIDFFVMGLGYNFG
jgi:OmpA-OmpF porin, OOP family